MVDAEEPLADGPADSERRRAAVARLRFQPDPRRLRSLLAEVDRGLGSADPVLRRRVRLLVGEIVSRLMRACPGTTIELELELRDDSVRIDMIDRGSEPSDFWEALDDVIFSDLTTAWGRDRRRSGGAWFEVEAASPAYRRTEAR